MGIIRIDEGGLKKFASKGGLRIQTARFMKNLRTYRKSKMWIPMKKPDYFMEGQQRPYTCKAKKRSRFLSST